MNELNIIKDTYKVFGISEYTIKKGFGFLGINPSYVSAVYIKGLEDVEQNKDLRLFLHEKDIKEVENGGYFRMIEKYNVKTPFILFSKEDMQKIKSFLSLKDIKERDIDLYSGMIKIHVEKDKAKLFLRHQGEDMEIMIKKVFYNEDKNIDLGINYFYFKDLFKFKKPFIFRFDYKDTPYVSDFEDFQIYIARMKIME